MCVCDVCELTYMWIFLQQSEKDLDPRLLFVGVEYTLRRAFQEENLKEIWKEFS